MKEGDDTQAPGPWFRTPHCQKVPDCKRDTAEDSRRGHDAGTRGDAERDQSEQHQQRHHQ